MNWSQGHKCRRAGPVTCLQCGDIGEEEMPLAKYGRQESWPQGHQSGRGLVLHPGSTALHVGLPVSWPQGHGAASPGPHLLCGGMGERAPLPSFLPSPWWWPGKLANSVNESRSPNPHLGNTEDLALDARVAGEPAPRVWVWESQSCLLSAGQWCGQGRNALLPSLIPCHLGQVGEPALGS